MIWRHLASNFLTLLIVLLIGAAIAVAWGRAQYVQPGPSAVAQCVTVPQGASLKARVATSWSSRGRSRTGYVLRTGADYAGKAGQLKFGSYLVPPRASMEQVIGTITAGGPSTCGTGGGVPRGRARQQRRDARHERRDREIRGSGDL